MSLSHLRRAVTLSCLFLILWLPSLLRAEVKPAKEDVVRRGPSREPVPYRYDPALVKQVPRAFLEDGPACVPYAGTTYILEADGTLEEVSHELTRLNNRRGVEVLGEYRTISYAPSYPTPTLNVARIHKPDGRTVEVSSRYVHVRDTNTDYVVYDHYKQLVISLPDLAVGNVIEIEWTPRGKDPEGQGHFFASYLLGNDDDPVYLDELRVQLPRARALRYRTQGGTLYPVVQERGDARALADLEKAAELSRRQDGAVLHRLAAALFQAGRGKDAVVTQREALQRRPHDGEFAEQLRRFEDSQRSGGQQ